MRTFVYYLIVIGILTAISLGSLCHFDKDNTLEGVWELKEGRDHQKDHDSYYPSKNGEHQKVFTKNFFQTIWQDWSENPGSIYPGFNGGLYILNGSNYTEHHNFNYYDQDVGKVSYYKIRVEDYAFYLSPAEEDGNSKEFGHYETWIRKE